MLVEELVLLSLAHELLATHSYFQLIVVSDFQDLLLQRLNLLGHVPVRRLQLLLQCAYLFVLRVCELLQVGLVPDLHGFEPFVLFGQLLFKLQKLLLKSVRVFRGVLLNSGLHLLEVRSRLKLSTLHLFLQPAAFGLFVLELAAHVVQCLVSHPQFRVLLLDDGAHLQEPRLVV